jgi:hypothetical protein
MEHLVTDEPLVEGKGGCYMMALEAKLGDPVWRGSVYGNEVGCICNFV